jgi:hypothetical protein
MLKSLNKKQELLWFQYKKHEPITLGDGYSKAWIMNGEFHRVDGPALITKDGVKVWMQKGKLHRPGLPVACFKQATIKAVFIHTNYEGVHGNYYKPYKHNTYYYHPEARLLASAFDTINSYVEGHVLSNKQLKLYNLKKMDL